MSMHIRQINQRMSLRKPQQFALDALHRLVEKLPMKLDADLNDCLKVACDLFPNLKDFEREFPNICLALATGVGKTRLMGAIITYLALEKGIRNFFILAPNNTITEKLVREFSNPLDDKYVFKGISEFVNQPPRVITAENYDDGYGVRNAWAKQQDFLKGDEVHINIFNIAMIHSQERNGVLPRIKRPRETIRNCLSYYDYLAQLEDLVVLMDEAHHYRANAGSKAINDLRPILGIELTATPQVVISKKDVSFQNIIYHYPLSEALNDEFVKEPWVAGRENFDPSKFDVATLERLKLEDGIRLHESTKLYLQNFTLDRGLKPVKPFMLVITENMGHANAIEKILKGDDFFGGNYKDKIRVVHSAVKADEEERMIKDLLEVESFDNPTEIVIHVNMLREGWDVKNLYTIVPLRAANSKTLIEQSIGRGLRLPFGKRTGIVEIDRLTIVSHDRFKEIVDEANKPGSLIRSGGLIGRDVPDEGVENVEVRSKIFEAIQSFPGEERFIGEKILNQINHAGACLNEEFKTKLINEIEIEGHRQLVSEVCDKVYKLQDELSISIPRIVIEPMVVIPGKYNSFLLDLENVRPLTFSQSLLIQNLVDGSRETIQTEQLIKLSEQPEEFIAKALLDQNDVAETDEHLNVVLDVSAQMVNHLRGYLKSDEELHNVIINYRDHLVNLIHRQMQLHYTAPKMKWNVVVARNYSIIKSSHYVMPKGKNKVHYNYPLDQKSTIKDFLYTGFKRSCFEAVKFESEPERIFANILEHDVLVKKWIKPARGTFQIFYHKDTAYEPDFVVESEHHMYLVEIKRRYDLEDEIVKKKAEAATFWCTLATNHANENQGRPWSYLLIPHDEVDITMTLGGLASRFTCCQNGNQTCV